MTMTMQATLATNVALTGTVTQTAVTLRDTPLVPYRSALVLVNLDAVTGTPTLLIEGSENGGTSYVTLATFAITAGLPSVQQEVKLYPLTRVRQSVAGSAGIANVYAIGVQ
jgi:hypothetical protein